MSDQPNVSLHVGLPETVLPPPPPEALNALARALAGDIDQPEAGAVGSQSEAAKGVVGDPGQLPDSKGLDHREATRQRVASVVASHPTFLEAWATLSSLARDEVEAYAYARVGYHRGLDALRAAGWKGSGYVRWAHRSNRGFLRALDALRSAAEAIGETEEAKRCSAFLRQLEPAWDARADSDPDQAP